MRDSQTDLRRRRPALPSLFGHHAEWGVSLDCFVDDHNASATAFEALYNFLRYHLFPRIAFIPISISPKKTVLFATEITAMGFELERGQR